MNVVIVDTNVTRSTKNLVEKVRLKLEKVRWPTEFPRFWDGVVEDDDDDDGGEDDDDD